jgi:transforming growth factor-beta-induced protein
MSFGQPNGPHIGLCLLLACAGACSDSNNASTPATSSAGTGGGAGAQAATSGAAGASATVPGTSGGAVDMSGGGAGAVAPGPGSTSNDIVDTAVAAGGFSTLAKALGDTDLVATLKGPGPFTVFAPTDAAFAALPAGTLDSLSSDELKAVLLYHVVAADLHAADLDGKPLTSVGGLSLFVSLSNGVMVDDARVTMADVNASNGVIHVIDKVLLPPNIVQAAQLAGNLTTLVKAVTDTGLADALSGAGPFTVFAPSDAAFAALPAGTLAGLSTTDLKNVLLYHVVSGSVQSAQLEAGTVDTLLAGKQLTVDLTGGVNINDAKVTIPDIVVTNGVIHVIDKVLLP